MAAPLLLLGLWTGSAIAQPADLPIPAAATTQYPPGVKVIQTDSGPVYADARGMVLYGMDMRTLIRWASNPAVYCRDECVRDWEPLLAPADAKPNVAFPRGFGDRPFAARPSAGQGAPRAVRPPPVPEGFLQPNQAPDWAVVEGAQGPQWVYKGWHVVFTRRNDQRGSTAFDGAEELTWNTLKFVPPVPEVSAPAGVKPVFVDGAYALADKEGRVLFTGNCRSSCNAWVPFGAGMASQGLGQWTVGMQGDSPQWHFRGKSVFVSQEEDSSTVPAGGKPLRP